MSAIVEFLREFALVRERTGIEQVTEGPLDEAWLRQLRLRFTEIAARRVDPAAVEDVVQDALRVVFEKAGDDRPRIDWCFQVLRNVVGNHYRREHTRRRFVVADPEGELGSRVEGPDILEALEGQQLVDLLRSGVSKLGSPCSEYLGQLMEESTPATVASEVGLTPEVFYRRLYRCRQKLRTWLRQRGIEA